MNFDLNIDNYSRDELIEMFELPPNFDENIIDMKEAKLRDSIINNREINKDTQEKTLNFIIKAKNIILYKEKNKKINELFENVYHGDFNLKPVELDSKGEHMVQVRKDRPYISSSPSEYFAGVINPLKRKSIKQVLNIDSRFRDNYYGTLSSNFNIFLPMIFTKVATMILNAIELPTSYYTITKEYGNNFFTVVVNGNSAVINLPSSNYTQNSIMAMINTQLANLVSVDADFGNIVFSINLTSDITGSITGSCQTMVGFNGSQSPNATLELNFQADRFGIDDRSTPLPLKLGWILGFRNGVYVNNTNYVSEGLVDTSGPKYVYLVVDDYNNNVNNNYYSAYNSSMLNKNILARISLQTNQFNPFGLLEQNNLSTITTPREYFGPVNIQTLTIQLLDEYGRILDLNNMDFSFCITLTSIYDL
jgi:hypothetical protein